ncbi:MAG: hypothetical protein ACFFCW_07915 [Candidatus Hodarchaeota archaeon]
MSNVETSSLLPLVTFNSYLRPLFMGESRYNLQNLPTSPISNVVLLEGYAASGKSSLVCRLAYDLVNDGKKVYYGNLTNSIGLKCAPREQPSQLLDESKKVTQEIFVIIEDIHHLLNEFDRSNPLASNRRIKLILTSRPLAPFESETKLFQWIVSTNRLALKTDKTIVREILRHGGFRFSNLQLILNIIGEKKPNLLLLSFMIQVSSKKPENVDRVTSEDVLSLVGEHLVELALRVCSSTAEEDCYWELLVNLSTFSEFELPVERDFLSKLLAHGPLAPQILQKLEKEKEILSFRKLKPYYMKYYVVPHSKLASLYRNACAGCTKRLNFLGQYLLHGEFFGTLAKRMKIEDKETLADLVHNLTNQLIERNLSKSELSEIGDFLDVITWADRKLTREITFRHTNTLKAKLSESSLTEITDFLDGINWADRDLAKEISSLHADTLIGVDFSRSSLAEVKDFLIEISIANWQLARKVFSLHADKLKIKFSVSSLTEIIDFLKEISGADKELGQEAASLCADKAKTKFSDAKLAEIGDFLDTLSRVNKDFTRSIIFSYANTLKAKDLSEVDATERRYFLRIIDRLNRELADEMKLYM